MKNLISFVVLVLVSTNYCHSQSNSNTEFNLIKQSNTQYLLFFETFFQNCPTAIGRAANSFDVYRSNDTIYVQFFKKDESISRNASFCRITDTFQLNFGFSGINFIHANINWIYPDLNTNPYVYDTVFNVDDSTFPLRKTSVESLNIETKTLQLWPNPVSQNLNLQYANLPEASEFYIYNTLGQVVKNEKLLSGTQEKSLNVSELPDGVYNVLLANKTGNRLASRKFLKQ